MKTIVLIACCKTKEPFRCKAAKLYKSSKFKKSLAYAKSLNPDAIYILSGKYGIVDPETIIEPYDEFVSSKKLENRQWADRVIEQLKTKESLDDCHFVFLAGEDYRKNIISHIRHFCVPMQGLSQGEQGKWLKEQLRERRLSDSSC